MKPVGFSHLIERFPFGVTPKTMPVETAMLRNHLQLTHNLDDALVVGAGSYLEAATGDIERRGQVSLITQQRSLILDEYPEGSVCKLPFGPVQAVDSVSYIDTDGVTQTLAPTEYSVQPFGIRPTVAFTGEMPSMMAVPGCLKVNYTSGYGDTPDAVPAEWRLCVMILAFHMYERREGLVGGNGEAAFERMIAHRVLAAGARKTY